MQTSLSQRRSIWFKLSLCLISAFLLMAANSEKAVAQDKPLGSPGVDSPRRAGENTREVELIHVKIEPDTLAFRTTDSFPSQTKSVVIRNDDSRIEWTFVRFKPGNGRVALKASSFQASTEVIPARDAPIVANQWIAFKDEFRLDITYTGDSAEPSGNAVLEVEKGSVRLADDSLKAATDAIKDDKVKPTSAGNSVVALKWDRIDTGENNGDTSWGISLPTWLSSLLLLLLVIGVVAVIVRFTVWNKIVDWRARRREPRAEETSKYPTKTFDANARSDGFDKKEPQITQADFLQLKTELAKSIGESFSQQNIELQKVEQRLTGAVSNSHALLSDSQIKIPQVNESLRKELKPTQELVGKFDKRLFGIEQELKNLKEQVSVNQELLAKQEGLIQAGHQTSSMIVEDLAARRGQLDLKLSEILRSAEQKREPDLTYARMLGKLLGENVDTLQADNFQQFGEALNRFFGKLVPADDSLLQLKLRADSLRTALDDLSAALRHSNKQVDADLDQHISNARHVCDELKTFYSQLSSGESRLFLTDLSIPVGTHANARNGFLEGLGTALKREIEKFRDPQAYFEHQLRQLAHSEVVPIADICDLRMDRSPGATDELEGCLVNLFEHAGLEQIVPQAMQDYQSSQQELLDMVSSPSPEMNRKVAKVVSRGFNYGQDLLRKAGVAIYG